MGIFGDSKAPPPKEALRKNKRTIERAIREIDRERERLKGEETRLSADLKKAAAEGHKSSCTLIAKNIVRSRNNSQRMYKMRTNLNALSLRMTTISTQQQMAECVGGVSKILTNMNKKMNVPAIQGVLMEFQRENDKMDQAGEMLDDAMDDAFAEDGEDEEADELVQKVLDEYNISLDGSVAAKSGAAASSSSSTEDELAKRLDALRRG